MALVLKLPDDALAAVLRRLPPRGLAVSRRICKAWRDVIDARRLLRPDLLPFKVGGIFICASKIREMLFAPIPISLDFVPENAFLLDHRNGLVLYEDSETEEHQYIVNPATRQVVSLPLLPSPADEGAGGFRFRETVHLVFDPVVSPHYEVLIVPVPLDVPESKAIQPQGPCSSCTLQVYSSVTGRWEERLYFMEGDAVRTNVGKSSQLIELDHYSVFWGGALFVPWDHNFLMKISLLDDKFRIIELPMDFQAGLNPMLSLGRSKDGVHCVLTAEGSHESKIWLLDESHGQMQWVLKHSADLTIFVRKFLNCDLQNPAGPWILSGHTDERAVDENYEWNSDEDSVLDTEGMVAGHEAGYVQFLGFHPRKEIVFFNIMGRAVAYHWSTVKFQDLGNLVPENYEGELHAAFVYTPCWMEELPGNILEGQIEE